MSSLKSGGAAGRPRQVLEGLLRWVGAGGAVEYAGGAKPPANSHMPPCTQQSPAASSAAAVAAKNSSTPGWFWGPAIPPASPSPAAGREQICCVEAGPAPLPCPCPPRRAGLGTQGWLGRGMPPSRPPAAPPLGGCRGAHALGHRLPGPPAGKLSGGERPAGWGRGPVGQKPPSPHPFSSPAAHPPTHPPAHPPTLALPRQPLINAPQFPALLPCLQEDVKLVQLVQVGRQPAASRTAPAFVALPCAPSRCRERLGQPTTTEPRRAGQGSARSKPTKTNCLAC